jgi:hypothetical protein
LTTVEVTEPETVVVCVPRRPETPNPYDKTVLPWVMLLTESSWKYASSTFPPPGLGASAEGTLV